MVGIELGLHLLSLSVILDVWDIIRFYIWPISNKGY